MSPDNIFPKLSESQYYSTFDFSKGYWAIPMEEKSKDYTLFITSRVLMRFKVTPFGMVNSASTYNRMVRKLLDGAHDLEIGKDTNRCREISLKESKGQICPWNPLNVKSDLTKWIFWDTPSRTIRRTSDLRLEFRPQKALRGWSAIAPKQTTWLTAAILKIDITSYFSGRCSDLDVIQQPDAEWYADNGKMVKIETGSRIKIWRTFVFRNRK